MSFLWSRVSGGSRWVLFVLRKLIYCPFWDFLILKCKLVYQFSEKNRAIRYEIGSVHHFLFFSRFFSFRNMFTYATENKNSQYVNCCIKHKKAIEMFLRKTPCIVFKSRYKNATKDSKCYGRKNLKQKKE